MRVTERRAPHVPASSLMQKSTRQYDPCKEGRRADALEDMDQSVHPPELDDVSTYDAGRKDERQSAKHKREERCGAHSFGMTRRISSTMPSGR